MQLIEWKYRMDPEGAPETPGYDDSNWQRVSVPHDRQITCRRDPDMPGGGSQGFYPHAGVDWYRTSVTLPRRSLVRLTFEGILHFATVWINGVKAGERAYGYLPLTIETVLPEGESLICVRADNSLRDCWGGGADRWYTGCGMFREVRLEQIDERHIEPNGVQVYYTLKDGRAEGRIAVKLSEKCTGNEKLRALITHGGRETAIWAKAGEDIPFAIDDVEVWDTLSPALYGIEVCLSDESESLDIARVRTGFRETHFDPDRGYFLNGKNIKLKGVDLHHDAAAFGAAVPYNVLRRRLEKVKQLGCNAVRCSHNPKETAFYDLCDELGLLVIDELYDKWRRRYFAEFYDRDRDTDTELMVMRTRNHPCVILWSVGNECEHQYTEEFYDDLRHMCERVRTMDDRPVSYALIGYFDFDAAKPGVLDDRMNKTLRYCDIVDVFMGNYMEGFYEELRRRGMKKAVIGSEIFSYYRLNELTTDEPIAVSPWSDVTAHDYVAGGFIWAGIDYLGESMGWPCRGWTGSCIDSAGFPKLRAEMARAWWSNEPVIAIGVLDGTEPYDMANANWSFPQMSAHWRGRANGDMLHVGVITNCDEVRLQLNDGRPRVQKRAADGMAHFLVAYRPGTIKATGITDGKDVCEASLTTSERAERLEAHVYEKQVRVGDIFHVEAVLYDRFGQVYADEDVNVRFCVSGAAACVACDNGDFMDPWGIYDTDEKNTHMGHLCGYFRALRAGECEITVRPEGLSPIRLRVDIRG